MTSTISTGAPDQCGLFGYVSGANAEIKNLGLEDTSIQANVSDYIGGLVGYNEQATISSCYVSGAVIGNDFVGGLVGYNYAGLISDCFTLCQAGGIWFVGGLAGANWEGTVNHSYAATTLSGFGAEGGFLGYDNAGAFEACFWDNEIAGASNGVGEGSAAGITPGSTNELQTQQTFLSAGWDFVEEDDNGTSDTWRMCVDNQYYPRLAWQYHTCDLACPDGVEINDLAYLAECWLDVGVSGCGLTDFDGDGIVNLSDFAILAANWLQHNWMSTATSPQTAGESMPTDVGLAFSQSGPPERPDPQPLNR